MTMKASTTKRGGMVVASAAKPKGQASAAEILMPTPMPTGATSGCTRRTYDFLTRLRKGLFIGFCGRRGTTRTL
jgi:hypothetical protein